MKVSVVIPARNEARLIGTVVEGLLRQDRESSELEILVVDDGSTDGTAEQARAAGARVVPLASGGGNPARARNLAIPLASGDPVIFLDADCVPAEGWLAALLAAHARAPVVGGSLGMPPGLPPTARADYYCCWYQVHPGRRAGKVPNHPPANLSVRREILGAVRFAERHPVADGHEELEWQAAIQRQGHEIYFEPRAVVSHHHRPGLANLLRHAYRWGYSAVEAKAGSGAARFPGIYRHPGLLLLCAPILAPLHSVYVLACWLRAGVLEPLWLFPVVFLASCGYTWGIVAGGVRWLRRRRRNGAEEVRAQWR